MSSLRLRSIYLSCVFAIAGLLSAGCFNKANEFKCTDSTHCPGGYVCVGATPTVPGLCQVVTATDGGGTTFLDTPPAVDGPRGVDGLSSVDGTAPPLDTAAQAIDSPAASDIGSAADVGVLSDVAPDYSALPDSGPDQASDTASDIPMTPADAPKDVALDVGADLSQLKGQGAQCSSASECLGGQFCADGVCCNTACTEQCKACNLSGTAGTCTRQSSGAPAAGHTACVGSSPCGGSCNATSDTCVYPGSSQTCGSPASCSTDLTTVNFSTCDAKGACAPATQDCTPSGYCSNASCTGKLSSGSCTSNVQCSSNNCSLGICCPSGQTNSNGVCCASGLTGCSGQCVNTNTNSNYCGSCTNSCTGGNTCSGGSCACPNTSTACGPTCSACGSGQQCTGGNCACPGGAAFRCNSCLYWDFESGSTSGWTLSTRNDGTGSLTLVTSAGRGNYSLMIQNASFPNVTSDLLVQISLCSGVAVPIPAGGFSFSVDVLFQSNGYGFGDDGTGAGSPAVVLEGDAGTAFSHILVSNVGPFTNGTWYPSWSWTFTGTSASTIDVRFAPQAPWSGNIILDNISIK